MKIIFVTNIISFHQISTWDSFVENLSDKDEFIYLSTSKMYESRAKMGFNEDERPYILKSYEMNYCELAEVFKDTDIVIVGSNEDERTNKFIWRAKKYFTISEHLLKRKSLRCLLSLVKRMLTLFIHGGYKNKYLLCCSSKIYSEYRMLGFKKSHIFRFGYFPFLDTNVKTEKNPWQLCFCARLLKIKRPLLAIQILEKFLKYDSRYKLLIIGEGEQQANIIEYINNHDLKDKCEIINFVPHDKVLQLMNKSTFYLFTSTKGEGWGAVLNESMSQGCIPIASSYAGSTDFLVKNGFPLVIKS